MAEKFMTMCSTDTTREKHLRTFVNVIWIIGCIAAAFTELASLIMGFEYGFGVWFSGTIGAGLVLLYFYVMKMFIDIFVNISVNLHELNNNISLKIKDNPSHNEAVVEI